MLRMLSIVLIALFAVAPAWAWRVAETPHFRIYSEGREDRLRASAAALEDYHRLLVLLTGKKWPAEAPPLDIYLIDGRQQMRLFFPTIPTNVAGIYVASSGGILALSEEGSRNPAAWDSGQQTLLHEYAHHFMMQTGGSAPAWYVEGFAEYLMTATFQPEKVEFGRVNQSRAYALAGPGWIDLEKLLGPRAGLDPGMFYAQSWLLTHYMFRTQGMGPKLRDYLRRVSAGEESVSAFKAAVNPDLVAFQRELRRYVRSSDVTFSRMTRERPDKSDIRITELPASAENILLPLASMQLPQKRETDERSLKRIRDAAARFRGDPYAEKALAIAEAISGDADLAAARLDALLKLSPDDVDLLRWRARLLLDKDDPSDEDRSQARRLLVRAFKLVPNNWLVLVDYVDSFDNREKLPPAVLDVLLKASLLAPQVNDLAVRTGFHLAKAGDYALAHEILEPAVLNPHGRRAASIEKLLEALKSEDKAQVDAAFKDIEAKKDEAGEDAKPDPEAARAPIVHNLPVPSRFPAR